MKFQSFALPALALGTALLLIGPAEESYGFSKIGGSLGLNQRDFRVRNNFLDAASNNNTSAAASWPGWSGAFLAVWKGHAEWNSMPHGPNAVLGSGGANFDSIWAGEASAIGNTNNNIVSALQSGCSGGVLAFTETPISDGWRIRFCENWTWSDGPGGGNGILPIVPGNGESGSQGGFFDILARGRSSHACQKKTTQPHSVGCAEH